MDKINEKMTGKIAPLKLALGKVCTSIDV